MMQKIEMNISPEALHMVWESDVTRYDALRAFQAVQDYLDESEFPTCVLLDLEADIQLSIEETIDMVMRSPFEHENLAMVLVVGGSKYAELMVEVLSLLYLSRKIKWYKDEAEANEFLSSRCLYILQN